MSAPVASRRRGAFSLLELLIVLLIIAVIARFAVPAVVTLLRGSNLTIASETFVNQLHLARQFAATKNHAIEVRLLRFGDPEVPGEKAANPMTGQFRALQLFELLDNGVAVAVDKMQLLPESIVMNSGSLSSLFQYQPVVTAKQVSLDATAPPLPRGVGRNYEYVAFRFLPDGATNLAPDATVPPYGIWYITLHDINDLPKIQGSHPPANYFTLQIDPLNGAIKSYRPMLK